MNISCLRGVIAIVLAVLLGPDALAEQQGGTPTLFGGQRSSVFKPITPQTPSSGQPGGMPGTGTNTPSNAPAGTPLQFVLGDNNVVRVPTDTATLTVTGLVGLDKLGAVDVLKLANSLSIADRGIARGIAAGGTFELLAPGPEFLGRSGANGLAWRVPVKAKAPDGTSHMRLAALSFGTPEPQSYALEFSVSAKPAAASPWTPRGATDIWTVSWSDKPEQRVFGITIENPDDPIANLRLAQSTLKDASGHTIGVERLRLLDRPDGNMASVLGVPGNSTRTVFLRLEGGDGPFGTFDGVVRLTADGNAAMKDVSLKVQASSTCRRWIGVGLTLAGLFLTIYLSALARPQMERLLALRAAAALRQGIAQLVAEIDRTVSSDVQMPTMKSRAGRLSESISDDALDRANLLPPPFALGPGSNAAPDTALALKAKLDEVSKVYEGLLVLLRNGMPPVLRLMQVLAKRDEALGFAGELDTFAESVTGPQDAKMKADDVRSQAIEAHGAEAGAVRNNRDVTMSELDLQIQGLAAVAWGIWGLIALVTGAAWIFTDPDYGTTVDLVSSFAWGFGMITFGAGIQNLTPSSVATQMNVKIPK